MNEIHGEAAQGFEVPEAAASRIRGLILDARDLEIHISGLGVFVEALPNLIANGLEAPEAGVS